MRNRQRLARRATLCIPVLFAVACQQPQPPTATQPAVSPADRGLVWMFPGIEGGPFALTFARNAFRDAGVDAEIRIYDWRRPFQPLANLTEYEENRAKARQVAADLALYHAQHPTAPIDLVGYSGGGGLVVMIAEALPEEVRLRNVLLVQPALSPDYDLTAALRRIDGQLVNFYSPHDWFILGWGTKTFGTMDRKYVDSAGKQGFDAARAAPDATLRKKIVQEPWRDEMVLSGHLGNHLSIMLYGWNKKYVAPYLCAKGNEATRQQGNK